MPFKLSGPKGGAIIKSATLQRVRQVLPDLVKRFGKVTVAPAPPVPVTTMRDKVVYWAKWGVRNEPLIHYAEKRPMPLQLSLPITTDCSGFATLCYWLAHAPDPNGLGYNGSGYTGTLLTHGNAVLLSHVRPGDLVFYGPDDAFHTAIVVEAGPDPLTVSHGQEKGPALVRVSEDNRQPIRYRSYLP